MKIRKAVLPLFVLSALEACTSAKVVKQPDPLAAGLETAIGDWLEVRSFGETVEMAEPWLKTHYRILVVRMRRLGRFRFGYRFTRVRPGQEGENSIERKFTVQVVPKGQPRDVTIASPLLALGDELKVPVPVGDPYGRLTDFGWLPVEAMPPEDLEDRFSEPCDPPPGSVIAQQVSPYLGDVSFRCRKILMASLREFKSTAARFVAKQAGELVEHRVRVLEPGARISQLPRSWCDVVSFDRVGESSSTDNGLDKNLWYEMRPGDVIMLNVKVERSLR